MEISFSLNCNDETFITLLETIGKFAPVPREEAKATMKNKETKPRITLEQLRERLALMSQQGNHENVKALLRKYGGERLTDIPEDSYEELFNEAVNEAVMEEKA